MISISIGNEQRLLKDASAEWINQQIQRRRADGQQVCVIVSIRQDDIDMTLATPGCGSGRGGRRPNSREREIFDLWHQRGLDDPQFAGGNVVAFLAQIKRSFA